MIEEMAEKEKEHLKRLIDNNAPIDFIHLSQKYYNHFMQQKNFTNNIFNP